MSLSRAQIARAERQILRENRELVEKQARVFALEKAIIKTIKKHGLKLNRGAYAENLGKPGACVCAVGAALMSRLDAKTVQVKLDSLTTSTVVGGMFHTEEQRHAIMRWAARVVNEGVTKADLVQLELGFESNTAYCDEFGEPDRSSPFYKLGRRLKKLARRKP